MQNTEYRKIPGDIPINKPILIVGTGRLGTTTYVGSIKRRGSILTLDLDFSQTLFRML